MKKKITNAKGQSLTVKLLKCDNLTGEIHPDLIVEFNPHISVIYPYVKIRDGKSEIKLLKKNYGPENFFESCFWKR